VDGLENVILLIEDNPDDVELILRSFRKSKIRNDIVVLTDGAEALDWIYRRGEHLGRDPNLEPALILLDIRLPKIGGLEVLERIKADPETAYYPVVILTSSREEEDLFKSYELGANSYVRKPVDFQQFSKAVERVGLYWLLINERVCSRSSA
jgi:two-component system response regulator